MIVQLALVVGGIVGAIVCVFGGYPEAAMAVGGGAAAMFFVTMM